MNTSNIKQANNDSSDLQKQLEQKNAELSATQKALESISFTISHDLRAPLRTIDSFSQALAEDFTGELPEEATQHINRIRKATKNMRGMIDELLELGRVGRRKMEFQEFSLTKLAKEIIEEIQQQSPDRQVEFIIEDDLEVFGDKSLLKTALQQLIGNAWKFTLHQEQPRIELIQTTRDGKTIFLIKDNGVGFDMNYYEQLFDPFKRLHNDKDFDGLGVGLSKVHQIIERHNGKIWAESEPNQGASFYFTLGVESQN